MSENQTTPEQVWPDFCMTMTDDSMKPDGIQKGDKVSFVACDHVKNGQIAAVKVGEQVYLAHIWIDVGSFIQLVPSNAAYAVRIFTGTELDTVQIIGRAVEARHILTPAGSSETTPPQNDPQGVPV